MALLYALDLEFTPGAPIARRNVYGTLIKQSVARTEHSGVRTDTASGGFVNVCNRNFRIDYSTMHQNGT